MATAIARKVRDISEKLELSQEDVGGLVAVSSRSVSRWAAGDVVPHRKTQQRLLELAYVADAVGEVIEPEDARLWLMAPNPLLDGDSPADRIRKGDYRSVLGLIEALADGVVF